MRWPLALAGLFLLVFALCALSGPGRIDIVDGQTRYAVARSLVEHGDSIVRDDGAWMSVYHGRNGQRYAWYRLPHSLLGVPAILAADATAPADELADDDRHEMRRHFFFSMIGAVAAAMLAVFYALWFRALGCSPRASLLWALGGILCTPTWFYATSTFDDVLGVPAIVLAITVAWLSRERARIVGAVIAGLALAWAVNCKEPLGVFALPVLAASYRHEASLPERLVPMGIISILLATGCGFHFAYELYKFPSGTPSPADQFVRLYGPIWTINPLPALAGFAVSASAGVFFYCPPLYLALRGWWAWWRAPEHGRESPQNIVSPLPRCGGYGLGVRGCRLFALSVAVASGLFTLFFCFLTFFKGDPSWGPRYLTPVFAVGWLFVHAAIGHVRAFVLRAVLVLGVLVQLLGLSVDPLRLFFATPVHFAYYHADPWFGFNLRLSHLVQRPREIIKSLAPHDPESEFSPAPLPTYAVNLNFPQPVFWSETYQHIGRSYRIFNSLRPWWISQRTLTPEQRPVNHATALAFLVICALLGGLLVQMTVPILPTPRRNT